jgi:hypothetical protein
MRRKRPRSKLGLGLLGRLVFAFRRAFATRLNNRKGGIGILCPRLSSPFFRFRLRYPRGQKIASKADTGRLNLRWLLPPSRA